LIAKVKSLLQQVLLAAPLVPDCYMCAKQDLAIVAIEIVKYKNAFYIFSGCKSWQWYMFLFAEVIFLIHLSSCYSEPMN
jgi:hypothetical protein